VLISEQGPDVLQAVDVVDHASILEAVGGDSRAMAAAQLVFTAQYRSWWVGHEPSWALSSKRGLTQCCHLLPPRPAGCAAMVRWCANLVFAGYSLHVLQTYIGLVHTIAPIEMLLPWMAVSRYMKRPSTCGCTMQLL
jgi:hypothetical protein